ncbi:unnamed protein product, partial [Tilletia controversa]
SSRPGSVLATQASIDSNVAEARELLSPEALSVYISARSKGESHQAAFNNASTWQLSTTATASGTPAALSSLARGSDTTDATAATGRPSAAAQPTMGSTSAPSVSVSVRSASAAALSSVTPAAQSALAAASAASTPLRPASTGQFSADSLGSKASTPLPLFCSVLCSTNRVVTRAAATAASTAATAVARASGATVQGTKRPRAHVADADVDDRLNVRPRTDPDPHLAVGGTAHVTASRAPHPSSSPGAALPVPSSAAAPLSSATAPESTAGAAPARSHTPTPMEAFVRAFQNLSPTKRNTFVQAIMSTNGSVLSSAAACTPLAAIAKTSVTAAGTGPISATSDNTAVADVDGFNAFPTAAHQRAGSADTHTLVSQPAAGSDPAPSGPDHVELAAQGSSLLMSAPFPAPPQPLAPGWPLASGQAAEFPSDDALASTGLTGLATGHTSSAPHVSSLSGPGLSTASYDPSLLLGYNPHGTVGEVVQLPCQTTLNKVAGSHYLELWHFTPEGIAAGYNKAPTISETGQRLLDQLGSMLDPPKATIPDELLDFETYFHASKRHIEAIRHVAQQQIDPVKRTILSNEAAAWEVGYENITKRQGNWAMTAKYSALLRQHYYTSTIGSNRPNPKLWQPNIWSHVIAIR